VAKGDLVQRLTSRIYDCRSGRLTVSLTGGDAQGRARLTLRPSPERVKDRQPASTSALEVTLPPGSPWTGSFRTPNNRGARTCVLRISSDAVRLGWMDFEPSEAERASRQAPFTAPGTVALCYSEAFEVRVSRTRCR
jgi:hypothetical protein